VKNKDTFVLRCCREKENGSDGTDKEKGIKEKKDKKHKRACQKPRHRRNREDFDLCYAALLKWWCQGRNGQNGDENGGRRRKKAPEDSKKKKWLEQGKNCVVEGLDHSEPPEESGKRGRRRKRGRREAGSTTAPSPH